MADIQPMLLPCEPAKIPVSELFALRDMAMSQQQAATSAARLRKAQDSLPKGGSISVSQLYTLQETLREDGHISVAQLYAMQELSKGQVAASVAPPIMYHVAHETPNANTSIGSSFGQVQTQVEPTLGKEFKEFWPASGDSHPDACGAYSAESDAAQDAILQAIFQAVDAPQSSDSDCSFLGQPSSCDSTEEGGLVSECTSDDDISRRSSKRRSPANAVNSPTSPVNSCCCDSPYASAECETPTTVGESSEDNEIGPPPGLVMPTIVCEPPQTLSRAVVDLATASPVPHGADAVTSPPPRLVRPRSLSLEPPLGLPVAPSLEVDSSRREGEPITSVAPQTCGCTRTLEPPPGLPMPPSDHCKEDFFARAIAQKAARKIQEAFRAKTTVKRNIHSFNRTDEQAQARTTAIPGRRQASVAVIAAPSPVVRSVPVLRQIDEPVQPRPRGKARVEQGRRRCKGQNLQRVAEDINELPKDNEATPTNKPTSDMRCTGYEPTFFGWRQSRVFHLLLVLVVLAACYVCNRQLYVSAAPGVGTIVSEFAWATESPSDASTYLRERTVHAFGKGMEIEIARAHAAAVNIKSKLHR